MKGKSPYLLLALVVLVLDQWSKSLVEGHIPLHSPVTLIPGLLNLTHVRNTGVAFGMFASRGELTGTIVLTVLGLGALAFVLAYFWRTESRQRGLLVSLGLILGGAVGNLVDRVASGAVTDFIDFYVGSYHWHTFNVADSAITVGIVIMAIESFWIRDSGRAHAAAHAKAGSESRPGASARPDGRAR